MKNLTPALCFQQSSSPLTHFFPLASGFVEKNGGGGADVERVHCRRHGDGHRFIASFQHSSGDAITFAAENKAAVTGEVRLRQKFPVRVRMRSDAADAAGVQVVEGLRQSP